MNNDDYLKRAAEHRALVMRLYENYEVDMYSPQPAAPKTSLTGRVLRGGALLGAAYLGGMGSIGAAIGFVRRAIAKSNILKKLKKVRALPASPARQKGIAELKNRTTLLPGYLGAATGGAYTGIVHPLRTLYHTTGLGYINRNL